MADKEAPKKTIIDVKEPGSAPASPTSKAVIVKNKPILKDPMMSTGQPPEDMTTTDQPKPAKPASETAATKPVSDSQTSLSKSSGGERVLPLDGDGQAVKDQVKEDDAKETKEVLKPEPAEAKSPSEGASPPASEEKEPASQAATAQPVKAQAEEKAAAEKAERQAAVAKLVESGQYYLPINKVEKRKAKRAVILGVILAVILALAWADVALDSGLIKISGVKAPTHFFSG